MENEEQDSTAIAKAGAVEGEVMPTGLSNAKNLIGTLATIMDGVIDGTIDEDRALVLCKISSETTKALDLIHRMKRDTTRK